MKFTTINFSKREAWIDRIRREAFVKNEINNNALPSVSNISAALNMSKDVITEEVLALCANVKTIELGLPVPNTTNVAMFSENVGPENSTTKIAGCYYIYSPTDLDLGSYVGHSIHLGKRVKDHAKGNQTSTGKLVQSVGTSALVRVYIPDPNQLPSYITIEQFILVLEQYLFYTLKPTINRALVATPGYSNPDMDNTKHIEKIGKNLFIYYFDGLNYYYIYSIKSRSELSHLLNKGRK